MEIERSVNNPLPEHHCPELDSSGCEIMLYSGGWMLVWGDDWVASNINYCPYCGFELSSRDL